MGIVSSPPEAVGARRDVRELALPVKHTSSGAYGAPVEAKPVARGTVMVPFFRTRYFSLGEHERANGPGKQRTHRDGDHVHEPTGLGDERHESFRRERACSVRDRGDGRGGDRQCVL